MINQLNKAKPIVSYWKSGDASLSIDKWKDNLTDINIINTKRLSDEFIEFCANNKSKIFLHIEISGLAQTPFEPNIPTVRENFYQIRKLLDRGFPQRQILVIVNPIIPNENGLKSLKLLLRLFTEFKPLRLRFIRFNLLSYTEDKNGNSIIWNQAILGRTELKRVSGFLKKSDSFYKEYHNLLKEYSAIISVDNSTEALIGVRELLVFGYKNEWFAPDGTREKIINYEKGNKFKPIVNLLSPKKAVRCQNRCLLCPWWG